MDPLSLMAIGGGAGLLKSFLFDGPARERQNKIEAAQARWSPWTGMKPNPADLKSVDPLGTALQGGMAGALMSNFGSGGKLAAGSLTNPNTIGGSLWGGMGIDPRYPNLS